MLSLILVIAVLLLLVAVGLWAGSTDESSGTGDNRSSANYYGGW
jgi:hypothetical protein